MAVLEPIIIPVKLGDINSAKSQLLELKKVADDATSPNSKEAQKNYDKLTKSIKGTNDAFKEQSKVTKDLTKDFIRNEEGMIEVSAQISLMEDQMFALRLEGKANTKEFENLRDKTVEFKQVVIATDKEIDLLTENTGLAGIGESLGGIGSSLASLDFVGAGKKAELLNKQMGTLGDLGKKSLKGLAKTVGQLSKAFIKFGISLLANPIFLMVAVFVAIGGAIAVLLDKLGLLKPILDAIGTLFGWIADAIDAVVQGFKDFADWIGLTDFAGEEQARNEINRLDAIAEKTKEVTDAKIFAIEEEAKIASINGENTLEIERRKQEVILRTAKTQKIIAERSLEIGKRKDILDEEEITKLEEKIALNKQLVKVTESELRVIEAKGKAETKREAETNAKEEERLRKERIAKAKDFAKTRIAIERRIQDLLNNTIEEGMEKEIEINRTKYDRLIEDTLSNEKILRAEKTKLIELLEAERDAKEVEINKKQNEEKQKQNAEFLKIITGLTKQEETDRLEIIKIATEEKLNALREASTLEQQQTEEFKDAEREIILQRDKALNDERRLLREEELGRQLELDDITLEQRLMFLDEALILELENKELLESEKQLIEQKYEALREEAKEAEAEREKQRQKDLIAGSLDIASSGIQAIQGLNDLAFSIKSSKLKKGSAEEERLARKNFETNKKLQIAQATIQGVQAVLSAYSSGSAVPIVGAVLGPLYAGLAGIATAGNIAKIKASTFEGGGGGVSAGGGSAPNLASATSTATEQIAPAINLFGNPNEGNNTSESQSVEKKEIVITAKVIATEMSDEQDKIKLQEQGASL